MVKLRVPKQEIVVKQITYKGRQQDITVFSAQAEDGTLYGVCEAWGNKKKALEEVMGAEKFVEAEKVDHNAQYNKYNVFFPRGFGGEANYRDRSGWNSGGDRGYKGKPVSTERFFSMTEKMMHDAVKICRHAMTAERFDKLTPEQVAQFILPVAQDLVSQHWIEVEKNVTFPDGCEPSPVSNIGNAQAQSPAQSGGGMAASINGSGGVKSVLMAEIASWGTADQSVKDAMTAKINAEAALSHDERVELHGAAFARMKELTRASA